MSMICRHCAIDVVRSLAQEVGDIKDAPPQCFIYQNYGDLAEKGELELTSFMLESPTEEALGVEYPSWAIQIQKELHSTEGALGFFTLMVVEDTDSGLHGLLFISYSLESDAFDIFLTDFEYSVLGDLEIDPFQIFGHVNFTEPLVFH